MNEATREYVAAIKAAERMAEKGVAHADGDRSAYYPCFAGALQAKLGAEIERRTGETVDYDAAREGERKEKAA